MGRILLTRHGQTEANREGVLQGPKIDGGLSELGQRQASSLAGALRELPMQALYSSPLQRARETAHLIVSGHAREHVPVVVVPEIYEMDYGTLTGRRVVDVRQELDMLLDSWQLGFVELKFPGGESPVLAQHRVRPFVARILNEARAGVVAVVGHGRLNRVLLAALTGSGLQSLESYPQANANITELEVDQDGSGAARILRLNDVGHLDGLGIAA